MLYSFAGSPDGVAPFAGVIMDATGNLFGTTQWGGSVDCGVVYKIDPTGHETLLHTFTNGTDGSEPIGGLTMDAAGNLYGTTFSGGLGWGVVFEITAAGQESVLYSFSGKAGRRAEAGLVLDSAGNLYGTAAYAGAGNGGVVFKLTP